MLSLISMRMQFHPNVQMKTCKSAVAEESLQELLISVVEPSQWLQALAKRLVPSECYAIESGSS